MRLTLLYGGLFLLSGAALMAIAYALLVNAGFVFTLGPTSAASTQPGLVSTPWPGGLPIPGAKTHPSAQTMAHWRAVARCMRQHGVARVPRPHDLDAPCRIVPGVISDHDGAIFAIPASTQHPVGGIHASRRHVRADRRLPEEALRRKQRHGARTHVEQLLIQSAIALGAMSLLSLGLGWILAGRVLDRSRTPTARSASSSPTPPTSSARP